MINIWAIEDRKEVAEYCLEYWREDCNHIIRVADEVCRNYFLFDLKWDMERTWEPVIFNDQIDWELIPGDDIEFVFQFNRHQFFICLGQAYHLTGEERYAERLVELWQDWIARIRLNQVTRETSWRSLETGLRGETWTKAFAYLEGTPYMNDTLAKTIETSLIEHAEHLLSVHSPYRYISNWGMIENHGLFEIGLAVTDSERRKRYLKAALDNLEVAAQMQIMNDGVQWEQSPMYHNEVFHCLADVWMLSKKHQIAIPELIKETISKMAYANLSWKKPDHHQFMMGDSDDTDIRDYLGVAAWLTKDPVLKFGGYSILDFDTCWLAGMQGVRQYQEQPVKRPEFTSVALADSGNYYFRSGWGEDASLLHFHCGTLGAGHGHSDKLHLDLVINGEDVLMDAGRYTYVDGPERREFKDPSSHNTITADQQWFTICKDSWECSKLSQPVKQAFVSGAQYEFLQGGHLGYMDQGVYINRKVIHIKPDIYIITDECYSGGSHSYQNYYHFNNQGEVILKDHVIHYRGKRCEADCYILNPQALLQPIISRVSRHYNLAEQRCGVVIHRQAQGFSSLITLIHGRKKGQNSSFEVEKVPVFSALKGIRYPDAMAEAVKIKNDQNEFVAIICHQEVNSPTDLVVADDCMGFGNVIVFHKNQSKLTGTVLNY